ncbi:MAG: SCO family protein [Planctomycetes bacterium]|nr:SCO family protein [Planctomycetota bacterium]
MRTPRFTATVIGAAGVLLAVAAAPGQVPTDPTDTSGIGIVEKLNGQVPLELRFTDDTGRSVTLGDYFRGEKPVLLTLVYYTCPGICNALLNGFAYTLADMAWTAGDEFEIVTVSIDPTESYLLADGKKKSYIELYGREAAADGWHFLVGDQENITALAEAVGFGYRYEQGTGLYTHAATLMVCTPDGRMSRYLNDVIFEPTTLQLALTEASQGTIGTPVARFLLRWCYTYDPTTGAYVMAARKVMTIVGGVTLILTVAGLGLLWRRELRTKRDGTVLPRPQT